MNKKKNFLDAKAADALADYLLKLPPVADKRISYASFFQANGRIIEQKMEQGYTVRQLSDIFNHFFMANLTPERFLQYYKRYYLSRKAELPSAPSLGKLPALPLVRKDEETGSYIITKNTFDRSGALDAKAQARKAAKKPDRKGNGSPATGGQGDAVAVNGLSVPVPSGPLPVLALGPVPEPDAQAYPDVNAGQSEPLPGVPVSESVLESGLVPVFSPDPQDFGTDFGSNFGSPGPDGSDRDSHGPGVVSGASLGPDPVAMGPQAPHIDGSSGGRAGPGSSGLGMPDDDHLGGNLQHDPGAESPAQDPEGIQAEDPDPAGTPWDGLPMAQRLTLKLKSKGFYDSPTMFSPRPDMVD